MLAVETIELTKDYAVGFWRKRPKRALDRLSLGVKEGEVFGLLGPNGAGKSTTLKTLLGLVFPTSGTAFILGRPLGDVAARARLGFLPENPYFYDHLTAEEFLTYMGKLFGLSRGEQKRRTAGLLQRVGLEESREVPLRKFSKGMLQRIGIAQALINNPELLFLDEPMSGLDPLGRRQVRDLILELKRAGKTVFFSTHILPDAETLCDRVAILNRGRLQGCGELHEILALGVSSTDLVLEQPPAELLRELAPYVASQVRTGDRVRLDIPREEDVPAVLEQVARTRTKIVSLNPVKASLEDYFLAQVATPAAPPEEQALTATEPRRGKR